MSCVAVGSHPRALLQAELAGFLSRGPGPRIALGADCLVWSVWGSSGFGCADPSSSQHCTGAVPLPQPVRSY